MARVSVIICAHNPRPHYFTRVLAALKTQTLDPSMWELIVVDNASVPPMEVRFNSEGHPHGRLVREGNLGLTHARLRGIAEGTGEILVFVDDDNLLCADYLEQALEISQRLPGMGAWGGGIRLQFEQPPPKWTRPFWHFLTLRDAAKDQVGETPFGAGLCVRRKLADFYSQLVLHSPIRQALDRSGKSLMSAGDLDLARTAGDIGLEQGVFSALQLVHLIPPDRLTENYLLRLAAAKEFSNHVLAWCRSETIVPPPGRLRQQIKLRYDSMRKFGYQRRFHYARLRGRQAAGEFLQLLQSGAEVSTVTAFIRSRDFGPAQ